MNFEDSLYQQKEEYFFKIQNEARKKRIFEFRKNIGMKKGYLQQRVTFKILDYQTLESLESFVLDQKNSPEKIYETIRKNEIFLKLFCQKQIEISEKYFILKLRTISHMVYSSSEITHYILKFSFEEEIMNILFYNQNSLLLCEQILNIFYNIINDCEVCEEYFHKRNFIMVIIKLGLNIDFNHKSDKIFYIARKILDIFFSFFLLNKLILSDEIFHLLFEILKLRRFDKPILILIIKLLQKSLNVNLDAIKCFLDYFLTLVNKKNLQKSLIKLSCELIKKEIYPDQDFLLKLIHKNLNKSENVLYTNYLLNLLIKREYLKFITNNFTNKDFLTKSYSRIRKTQNKDLFKITLKNLLKITQLVQHEEFYLYIYSNFLNMKNFIFFFSERESFLDKELYLLILETIHRFISFHKNQNLNYKNKELKKNDLTKFAQFIYKIQFKNDSDISQKAQNVIIFFNKTIENIC